MKSYRWLVPTGQLKCSQVLAPRNVHTPWPMVITEAACTRPMLRKTEINRHTWARSLSKMHAICVRRSSTSIRCSATPGSLRAGTGRPRKIVLRSLSSELAAGKECLAHVRQGREYLRKCVDKPSICLSALVQVMRASTSRLLQNHQFL